MRKPRSTYKSCSDLPLHNFIQVLIHDKKEMLYNRPNKAWYKSADLQKIWDDIFLEYIEESGDSKSKGMLQLLMDISVISNKLEIIQNCVTLLSNVSDVKDYQPTINVLKTFGFRYQFTNETLYSDLNRTVKSARSLIIQRDQLKSQLSDVNKNESEKATEKDFSVHLANLSESIGFAIKSKEITVMEYIGYLKVYNLKIEQNERTVNT